MDVESESIGQPARYLTIDRYAALAKGVTRKCEQWLVGAIPGERLVAMFDRVNSKSWMIQELNNESDDYDWEKIGDLAARGELLQCEFRRACLIMSAASRAIATMDESSASSPIKRAYSFGVHCQALGIRMDLR